MTRGGQRNLRRGLGFVALLASVVVPMGACERTPQEPSPIMVFAASSLTEPMTEAVRLFEADQSTPVVCNFAASSTLARQIEAGAPFDVYISAHPKWMDYLNDKGDIIDSPPTTLVCNELVWIVPVDTPDRGFKLSTGNDNTPQSTGPLPERLAIGDPDHVPAGIYAKQAMGSLGLWKLLEPHVVPMADVRAVLRTVESGEVDAGIVYASDAASSTRVRVAYTFPQATHDPIRYPLARCKNAGPNAATLIDYLRSREGAELFNRFGFMTECETSSAAKD